LSCSCGGCSQERRDGGVGEGGQDGGLRQPGGEVGFEGELVCVAGSHALAGLLLHHVVGEENVRLFKEAGGACLPCGVTLGLEEG
jgi:hypothetical protein